MDSDFTDFNFSDWVDFGEAEDAGHRIQVFSSTDRLEDTSIRPVQELNEPQAQAVLTPRVRRSPVTPARQPIEAAQYVRHVSMSATSWTRRLLTLDDEIIRRVNEPYAEQLRTLFNYLGSIQSLVAFKRALCDLRARFCEDDLVLKGARSNFDHLRIVKRLRESSAADSLLTMCHTMKLFEDEKDTLVRPPGSFVIQTQTSFDTSRKIGNPLSLAKAAVTDRKMALLYPGLLPSSEEYKSERQYVRKLRQSAGKLALFCDTFGFGVLAFLPYADPFGTGCHLNKCASYRNAFGCSE